MKSNIIITLLLISIIGACEFIPENLPTSSIDACITKSIDPTIQDYSLPQSGVIPERLIKMYVKYYVDPQELSSITPYVFEGDTLFYILNLHQGGWKILSGNAQTSPILSECESGSIDLENPAIPIQIILDDAKNAMLSLKSSNTASEMANPTIWNTLQSIDKRLNSKWDLNRSSDEHWIQVLYSTSTVITPIDSVNHLIPTTWDQLSPWDNKTPIILNEHCRVGCVPVAIGQVLYYFNQEYGSPSTLYESLTLQNPNTYPLIDQIVLGPPTYNSTRWSSMKKNRQASVGNSEYVADLLASIGYMIDIEYALPASGSDMDVLYLTYFGLTANKYDTYSGFDSSKINLILNNLNNNKPLIITMKPSATDTILGHAWIIDGYIIEQVTYSTTYHYYYVDDPYSLNGYYNGLPIVGYYTDEEMSALLPGYVNGSQTTDVSYGSSTYFLMNWGLDNGVYDCIHQQPNSWIINNQNYATGHRELYYNIRLP